MGISVCTDEAPAGHGRPKAAWLGTGFFCWRNGGGGCPVGAGCLLGRGVLSLGAPEYQWFWLGFFLYCL